MLPEDQIQAVITAILRREGGNVDDPLDHGGETHFGITIPFAGTWQIPWPPTLADARAGYRRMLAGTRIDQIPDAATLDLVADSAVNHGSGKAIQWLQTALGIDPDGIIGPHTVMVMGWKNDWPAVYRSIFKQRGLFYAAIIHNDPTQARFANGWFTRLFEFLT